MSRILDSYLAIARFVPSLFQKVDMAVWATDTEKFLLFDIHGRFKIQIKPGELLKPGGTPALAIKEQRPLVRYVPPEVYGIVCKTVALPVEGGVIGVSFSVENEDALRKSLEGVTGNITNLGTSSHEIARAADEVADFMRTLADSMSRTKEQLEEINSIGELIGDVAEDTRYISLNALIEANRAGEHGRSFTVVAKEMQRLSDQTQRSITKVHETLGRINQYVQALESQLDRIDGNLKEQSKQSRDVDASIRDITVAIKAIGELSQTI